MAKEKTTTAAAKKTKPTTSNSDKKDLAKLLYTRNNLNKKETAKRAGVTEKTLAKWVDEGKWDQQRKSLLLSRDEQLSNLMDQLDELNTTIKARPVGARYADRTEANTLGQITAAIKKLTTDTGLNEILEVCTMLLGFIQKNFYENMNTVLPILDAFVNSKLR